MRPRGGVWVCVFNSPREREYRKEVENYRDKFEDFGGLFLVASSFNFKYYGRFQMALQARTRFGRYVECLTYHVVFAEVLRATRYARCMTHKHVLGVCFIPFTPEREKLTRELFHVCFPR